MSNTTTTSPQTLQASLLRPPLLHILRAAGFTRTRPAVLDTLIDLTSRYLTLLANHTAQHAQERQAVDPTETEATITITDLRMALQDVGAFHPQISEIEELARGEEDLRGVEAFVAWCQGEGNAEIRRIAGMGGGDAAAAAAIVKATTGMNGGDAPGASKQGSSAAVAQAAAEAEAILEVEGREDFLTQLKKKHSKTGEESRWQGTVLGKEMGEREVVIEGGEAGSIGDWGRKLARVGPGDGTDGGGKLVGQGRSGSSSPLSEITGSGVESAF